MDEDDQAPNLPDVPAPTDDYSFLPATYDRVAAQYAETFLDELDAKPFDRELLGRFAEALRDRGRVCDLGCGPGQIGRYVRERGADVFGVDLSAGMVAIARELNPGMEFEVGDARQLPLETDSLAGIVAFYSLIHLPREEIPTALAECARVLAPGGALLISMHGGEGVVERDEFLGEPVPFIATLVELDEMLEMFPRAGFAIREAHQRDPYEQEHPTQRIYIWAEKRK